MDSFDRNSTYLTANRRLESFGRLLTEGSAESEAWTATRAGLDADLEALILELARKKHELAETKHQNRNILQEGVKVFDVAAARAGTVEDLRREATAWLVAVAQADAGKPYDDDGVAFMEPVLDFLLDPKRLRITEDRRRLDGNPVVVPSQTIRIVTMLVNELSMNAVKHGAFREEGGSVDVGWRVEDTGDSSEIVLTWLEHCTSDVRAPTASGSGYRGITQDWPTIYGYGVKERHTQTGLCYEFRIRHETVPLPGTPTVMVVDDWSNIYDLLDFALDGGPVSLVHAGSVEAALRVLDQGPPPDFVLLDRKLGDGDGFDVACELGRRFIPFAFLSGLTDGDWSRHSRRLRISKPVTGPQLTAMLEAMLTSPHLARLS